ncbi:MAG: hypothetical protein M0R03_20325 [Novosphingobium sp.]|nr:hypothetical protein [Novosphingobium sp.]
MKKVKRRKSPKRNFVKKFTPCPDYGREVCDLCLNWQTCETLKIQLNNRSI